MRLTMRVPAYHSRSALPCTNYVLTMYYYVRGAGAAAGAGGAQDARALPDVEARAANECCDAAAAAAVMRGVERG